MINKAIIVGNLTAQPEVKTLPNGTAVANFSVATSHVYKDKNGQKQETPEFHRIVVFGKIAENCAQYLMKGQQVGVEGRIQTRSWEQDGQRKYMTEIIADSVHFGRKPLGAPSREGTDASPAPQPTSTTDGKADEEIDVKDIPF